jgi:hypothetical protein
LLLRLVLLRVPFEALELVPPSTVLVGTRIEEVRGLFAFVEERVGGLTVEEGGREGGGGGEGKRRRGREGRRRDEKSVSELALLASLRFDDGRRRQREEEEKTANAPKHLHNPRNLVKLARPRKQRQPQEQLDANAPQAPHIDHAAVREGEDDFGRTVEAGLDVGVDGLFFVAGGTEVDYFDGRGLQAARGGGDGERGRGES